MDQEQLPIIEFPNPTYGMGGAACLHGDCDLGLIYPEAQHTVGDPMGLGLISNEFTRTLGADDPTDSKVWFWTWTALSTVSMGLSAYHGYRRNDSVGWAIGWAFLGALFPVITPAIALGQGFGQSK